MANDVDLSNFEVAYKFLSESILLVNKEGRVHFANPAFYQQFAVTPDAVLGQTLDELLELESDIGDFSLKSLTLSRTRNWAGVATLKKGGALPVISGIKIDTLCSEQHTLCYVARFEKQISKGQDNAFLQELAYRDELTGLANRTLFNQLLEHEISQSQREGNKFALLFIDLDRFKDVNDNLGHDAGDMLLCTIAERMQKSLRKSDVVARIGGDEFVVIMHNINDSDTVANVADKVIRQIHKPVSSGPHLMEVGCSIGISIFPENGSNAEHLLHHADVAMYRAKQQGGANYYYFSEELNQELKDTRLMEQQLIQGLSDSQFVPFFQPLLDQRNGQLVGIECLARWLHPQKGLLYPMEFIPTAKKVGLMPSILAQVLDDAFRHLKRWHQQLDSLIPLSVNITSKQFYQQQTFDELSRLLKKHDLSCDAIRIEVTESTLQEKGDGLIELLRMVSNAGFSITLDDFGTGYSSLRYLQQLPVDTLKIDRSFVRNLEKNPHDKIIVKAIIQLAQTLGIEAVAEGVETDEQRLFLEENTCHIMQGFLFSPAVSAEQFDDFLENLLVDTVS